MFQLGKMKKYFQKQNPRSFCKEKNWVLFLFFLFNWTFLETSLFFLLSGLCFIRKIYYFPNIGCGSKRKKTSNRLKVNVWQVESFSFDPFALSTYIHTDYIFHKRYFYLYIQVFFILWHPTTATTATTTTAPHKILHDIF